MILALLFVLSCPFGVLAQDISNGQTALPNKLVIAPYWPDCALTDNVQTFYNLRAQHCLESVTHFTNGEERVLKASDQQLFNETEQRNILGLTHCLAVGNANWVRNIDPYGQDGLHDYIAWSATWYPRNAQNGIDQLSKKDFEWQGCKVARQIADAETWGPDTPIVIDYNNDGIVRMTDRAHGANFALHWARPAKMYPWPADTEDGWLVFASHANGMITDGRQLFGPGEKNNGYLVLAGWDDNKDGWIDAQDGIWSSLAMWRDAGVRGVAEPGELLYLTGSNIKALSLDFKESRRKDRHGNEFRYRARVKFHDGSEGWTFDVILAS